MARPEIEPKTELAARLREIRRVLGDPERKTIAPKLGISKNALASYERGENDPSAPTLSAYVKLFGVSADWLLTGHGKMFGSADDTLHKAGGLLDRKQFERAIEAVCEGLGDHILPPKTMAKIVLIAYDMLQKDENSRDNIIQLVRAA